MKVRSGSQYVYQPVALDKYYPATKTIANLQPGAIVKVVNEYGCPKANTMGMCYIEVDGQFAGMVCCNSLQRRS